MREELKKILKGDLKGCNDIVIQIRGDICSGKTNFINKMNKRIIEKKKEQDLKLLRKTYYTVCFLSGFAGSFFKSILLGFILFLLNSCIYELIKNKIKEK